MIAARPGFPLEDGSTKITFSEVCLPDANLIARRHHTFDGERPMTQRLALAPRNSRSSGALSSKFEGLTTKTAMLHEFRSVSKAIASMRIACSRPTSRLPNQQLKNASTKLGVLNVSRLLPGKIKSRTTQRIYLAALLIQVPAVAVYNPR